ncbi:esterase-like activity of phytase family protein [Phormidium sp. CLA17]|uniref:esterase-like activity of phytase family protein n=1 Tax=Leptolyngbya sp. Cla-17 TaxID=2803751 RepID=UPI0014918D56|nr:esterase-like activity of phytase family protein [Leptolyngbya sp. Cla-17]MBM0743687.1 esterase-like activity of phytase family protein [Leptolyngbya sp. Cla-17]
MSDRRFKLAALLLTCVITLSTLLTGCDLPQVSAEQRIFRDLSLDFLSSYKLPKQKFQDTPVGGLSALTYDRQRNLLYAISDDRSELAPARFYTLKLKLDAANPKAPKIKQVDVTGVTFITDEAGQPYAKGTVDPEGIVLSSSGTLFISSEGVARQGIAPFVREFDLKTGKWKRSLLIPDRYLPKTEGDKQTQGVGDNLGFESLTLNMSGGNTVAIEPFRLFTATESALVQDASPDHPQQGASRNRVLHYSLDPTYSLLLSEHLYEMAPPPEGALYHGLTEMLAIDQGGHFISIERSFGSNGFGVKLFQLAMGSASDTTTIESLKGQSPGVQPIRKKLLFDLNQLGIPLDNLEGIAFGPQLPDGSQSLLLISDDNFNDQQATLFFLFRIKGLR